MKGFHNLVLVAGVFIATTLRGFLKTRKTWKMQQAYAVCGKSAAERRSGETNDVELQS